MASRASTPLSAEIIVPTPTLEAPVAEREAHQSDIEVMRRYFATQPRERIRVRKEDGRQFVQWNGYTFIIMPGEWVEVPTGVADMLREAQVI